MQFFDKLLDASNSNKPLMRLYLESYFDLYWDLHLGVKGGSRPSERSRDRGKLYTVLAYRDPTQKIVYENYMVVRTHLAALKAWIDQKLTDLTNGTTPSPEKTFAHYWIKNAGDGEYFAHKDVVFEVFHNFVALSQWGNTLYIMLKLAKDTGDADARAWFKKTMKQIPTTQGGNAFTPLERFTMELFRTINPNGGSISARWKPRTPPYQEHGYVVTPTLVISFDPVHWKDPGSSTLTATTARQRAIRSTRPSASRLALLNAPSTGQNSTLPTVGGPRYTTADLAPSTASSTASQLPVCDHAGFAPFGFGYRRCPGEQLTIQVFEDFLRKVWRDKIEFAEAQTSPSPEPPADRADHGHRRQCWILKGNIDGRCSGAGRELASYVTCR